MIDPNAKFNGKSLSNFKEETDGIMDR